MNADPPAICIHFVGFTDSAQFERARKIWGSPDFIHRIWDRRAATEIAPGDLVIFASGSDEDPPSDRSFDDSNMV